MFARTSLHLGWVLVLLWSEIAAAAEERDPELASAERVLKEARQATDGPALLKFFRDRTLADADRAKLAELVRRLGADEFAEREKASQDLVRAGRFAVPFLQAALTDRDPEIVRRARDCLQAIEQGNDRSLTVAAARVLTARRPDGAAEVLLAYLPAASDEFLEQAVLDALVAVGLRDGKADPAVVTALKDREPSRRAAAAAVLSNAGPELRREVSPLLKDESARVRFQAAAALTLAGEKSAVPALIALLGEGPAELAWMAEDLLYRLAGQDPPRGLFTPGNPEARKKYRDAWDDWWQAQRDKVDLAKLGEGDKPLGLTVVCELQGGKNNSGRVFALDADNKVTWQIDNVKGPMDIHLLRNGRVLIAEYNANLVTERDRDGTIRFEKQVNASPVSCQRLPNGNTFIATRSELLEVTPEGKTVYSYPAKGGAIHFGQKLRNGHILYVHTGNQIVELDTTGKEVRTIAAGNTSNWGSVELLPNGHFLVARCSVHQVVEIDATGKELWTCSAQWPTWAGRRPNGRTLVACANSGVVLEFDRDGKELWKQSLTGRPCRVRRY
jgi:hypothetical protein